MLSVYIVSQHYINDASIYASCNMHMRLSKKNMALGQVVTNVAGHVDTVLDTKLVYTRTT